MPMLGVIWLTLVRDEGSVNGEEDFFSVANTMPLVAVAGGGAGKLANKRDQI